MSRPIGDLERVRRPCGLVARPGCRRRRRAGVAALGTSTPIACLPGIGARMRTSGGGHGVGDVLVQAGDPGDLDARPELQLVAGDGRADGHADEAGLDAVLGERVLRGRGPVSSTSAAVDLWRRSARAAWPAAASTPTPWPRARGRWRVARRDRRPGAPRGRPSACGARATLPAVGVLIVDVEAAPSERSRIRPSSSSPSPARSSSPSSACVLSSCESRRNSRRAAPPTGRTPAATPAAVCPAAARIVVRVITSTPATATATSRSDRAPGGQCRSKRLADRRAGVAGGVGQVPARPVERRRVASEVQHPEPTERHEEPADRDVGERVGLGPVWVVSVIGEVAVRAHEHRSEHHQHRGHEDPRRADQDTDPVGRRPADRTCGLPVDAESGHQPERDQQEAGEIGAVASAGGGHRVEHPHGRRRPRRPTSGSGRGGASPRGRRSPLRLLRPLARRPGRGPAGGGHSAPNGNRSNTSNGPSLARSNLGRSTGICAVK